MARTALPDGVIELDINHEHDEEFKADPLGRFAELARQARIIRSSVRPWPIWYVLQHDDIVEVLERPEDFSSYAGSGLSELKPEPLIPQELDPPEHGRFRAPLNATFTPRAVRGMAAMVRDQAVAAVAAVAPHGRCDVMADIGRTFPTAVFMQIMGLPAADADRLIAVAGDLMHADADIPEQAAAKAEARRWIAGYLMGLIADRRADPRPDLLSELVTADVGGRRMSDPELLNMAILLYIAGLDTVAGAIGYIMQRMAVDPAHQDQIRRAALDGDDGLTDHVEELLRRTALVTLGRRVMRDLTFAGCDMRAGDRVILPTAAANVDPARFPDPDRHVGGRRPNRHLAFGHGVHRCLGSHLARLELTVFLQEWFARVPRFTLQPGATISSTVGGVASPLSLPLVWEPPAGG